MTPSETLPIGAIESDQTMIRLADVEHNGLTLD
jgi:hypothetical protein